MMEIRGLAYVVAESSDLDRWVSYARDVLGMMPSTTADGDLLIKMDERQFRFQVQPGSNDRYCASGWEVAGKQAFEQALKVLQVLRVLKKLTMMLLMRKLLTTTRNNPVYKAPSALLGLLDVLKVRRRRPA